MKISVVTVVRNACENIHKTVESVLSQSYADIEYIILDGLSTDGTTEILHNYEDRLSKLIVEKDNGLYDAMNKALKVATGDFLIFMNSGDTFYSSQTIETVVKQLVDNKCVFYGNVIQKNPDTGKENFFGGVFGKHRLCFKNICHQSIFYPISVYKQYNYNLTYKIFADYYYNLTLIADRINFRYMDLIVSYFELGGLSNTGDKQLAKDKGKIILHKFGMYYYLYYIFKKNIRIRQVFRLMNSKN